MKRLLEIAELFGVASLLSFGGTNAVVPHLRDEVVATRHWIGDTNFAECYAVAQVTPGPSVLLVTLLGFQAGGVAGALVATLAMTVPACLLAYAVARVWEGTGDALWHRVLEKGLGPVGVGLVAAAGLVLARAVNHDGLGWLITAAACALLALTRVNPLLVIALGGAAGLIGR